MEKAIHRTTRRMVLFTALAFALCFLVFWAAGGSTAASGLFINIFEVVYGFAVGCILLVFSRQAAERRDRFTLFGTSLAVLSWTLGQVFWFSYASITGEEIPYPSVGDLGYTGTYFFLIGVIGILSRERDMKRKWYVYASFLPLAIPVLLLFIGEYTPAGYLYNFVLALAACFAIFQNFRLLGIRKYRLFMCGVFFMAFADMVFMTSVCLFPDSRLYGSDMLYCLALAMISFGSMKGAAAHD